MHAAPAHSFPGFRLGLIGGVSLVILSLIGMAEAFHARQIIAEVVSMGHTLLLVTALVLAYLAAG
ncbi:MAG: hypothetical protein ACYDA8_16430, partial [Deferrisomatales bacterium]